jgi:type II secretory pathway pseudopilin PulG
VKLVVPHRSVLPGPLPADLRKPARLAARGALLALILGIIPLDVHAQRSATPVSDPAPAVEKTLEETLTAACRHDEAAFSSHLTTDNAQAYRALTDEQRVALLKRLVLREDPGKPLLSTLEGHSVVRCEAGGVTSEMRFGTAEVRENLAFIPVSVPEGPESQSVRFGLIRESGQWKLLSVGLLLLDIPAMGRQWEESDRQARERSAIGALRQIASALKSYQSAYGKLPETLDQLGPPVQNGLSPEAAGLLASELAKGLAGGYRFRYAIVPANGEGDESDRDKAAGFTLAATPAEYGKDGRRSFLLDSGGTLRGADKNGAVATADDPSVEGEDTPP